MFSKTIFKQTLKQNWKLWAIFTAILSAFLLLTITVFDPKMIQSMMDMLKDSPMGDRMADMGGGMFGQMGSLIGSLSGQFYGMLAVILPLIYILITANGLVAAKVDRGSMAYLLSTPIKRTKVVCTQAIYMIGSVLSMFLIVTMVGLTSVQVVHSGITGIQYTDDVKAASTVLHIDKKDVSDDLTLILNNDAALKAGAEARGIDENVYTMYLNLKMAENSGQTAEGGQMEQPEAMQAMLMEGLMAAAEVLNIDAADLAGNMSKTKANEYALDAAVEASGLPKEMFVGVIDGQLAAKELQSDEGVDFNVKDFLMLNLGCFLLMFAISGISFMFSCIFNLSKNSLALGAGIPIAFFVFQIMGQISDSLSGFKYLTLNTLYNPSAITSGGSFAVQFIVLSGIGVVLYTIGVRVFKKKDLPL